MSCKKCPHLSQHFDRTVTIDEDGTEKWGGNYYNCHYPHPDYSAGEIINNPKKTPEWCPLKRKMTKEEIEDMNFLNEVPSNMGHRKFIPSNA